MPYFAFWTKKCVKKLSLESWHMCVCYSAWRLSYIYVHACRSDCAHILPILFFILLHSKTTILTSRESRQTTFSVTHAEGQLGKRCCYFFWLPHYCLPNSTFLGVRKMRQINVCFLGTFGAKGCKDKSLWIHCCLLKLSKTLYHSSLGF